MLTTYGAPVVRLITDLEPVRMSLERAVPSGLILNELVSNALKHAFPQERAGTVTLSVRILGGQTCLLQVDDDGVGFPLSASQNSGSSLGLRLIHLLVGQIRGSFGISRLDRGTRAHVTFPLNDDAANS